MPPSLILGSASPRRRELLTQAGYTFTVHAAGIDESRLPLEPITDPGAPAGPEQSRVVPASGTSASTVLEPPVAYVSRLALTKAQAILALHPGALVLGADTTVVCDNEILNKPTDRADAERMLRLLADRTHHVHTGIAVVSASFTQTHVETTEVTFGSIPEPDLLIYLATGDSLDKAGAYGIQGYAARWIPRISGDFFNVMGLPLAATVHLLRTAGLP